MSSKNKSKKSSKGTSDGKKGHKDTPSRSNHKETPSKSHKEDDKFPVLPETAPTEDELKRFPSDVEAKSFYCLTVVDPGQSAADIYRRVPGPVLEPYARFLNGMLDAIHNDRIGTYKKANPGYTEMNLRKIMKKVPAPVYDFNQEKFEADLKPYASQKALGVFKLDADEVLFNGMIE